METPDSRLETAPPYRTAATPASFFSPPHSRGRPFYNRPSKACQAPAPREGTPSLRGPAGDRDTKPPLETSQCSSSFSRSSWAARSASASTFRDDANALVAQQIAQPSPTTSSRPAVQKAMEQAFSGFQKGRRRSSTRPSAVPDARPRSRHGAVPAIFGDGNAATARQTSATGSSRSPSSAAPGHPAGQAAARTGREGLPSTYNAWQKRAMAESSAPPAATPSRRLPTSSCSPSPARKALPAIRPRPDRAHFQDDGAQGQELSGLTPSPATSCSRTRLRPLRRV